MRARRRGVGRRAITASQGLAPQLPECVCCRGAEWAIFYLIPRVGSTILNSFEAQFLELLPTIDGIVGGLCRRRGLQGADAEDFAAHVRARFVESDYHVLREFRERSSITTFLSIVLTRWLKDYVVAREGRWRPSAAAQRLGPVAVHLERLLTKGRRSIDEAVAEVLSHGDHPYAEKELRALVRALPMREPMRPTPVSTDALVELSATPTMDADALVNSTEDEAARQRAHDALHAAMSALPIEERTIVAMRYLDGQSVADIARALRLEQKSLYRRIERALVTLRAQLERIGVSSEHVRSVVMEGGG